MNQSPNQEKVPGLFSTPLVMSPKLATIPIEQITEEKKSELLSEYGETVSVPEKKKRGRKLGGTNAPKIDPLIEQQKKERTLRGVKALVGMGLDWLAPRMPTVIETTETEKQWIAEPAGDILVELWPDFEQNAKYLALLGACALWGAPRMKGYKKRATGIRKDEKRNLDIRENGGGKIVLGEEAPKSEQAKRDVGPAL